MIHRRASKIAFQIERAQQEALREDEELLPDNK